MLPDSFPELVERVVLRGDETEQVRGEHDVERPDHVPAGRVTSHLPESLAHGALVQQVGGDHHGGQAYPALSPWLHRNSPRISPIHSSAITAVTRLALGFLRAG